MIQYFSSLQQTFTPLEDASEFLLICVSIELKALSHSYSQEGNTTGQSQ